MERVVGGQAFVGRSDLGHVKFEMSISHPRGEMEKEGRNTSLEITGKAQAEIPNLGVIRV